MVDNNNKVKEEIKGIELVWLSQTDLTNLNSGEGGTNYIDVKKYSKDGVLYPYVSGQAMRFYIKEAIRRNLQKDEFMCVPNNLGENCGNIRECVGCDLFGFMLTKKDEGAKVRVSPVKVSPAIGLLPLEGNSTIDYLTRKKRKADNEASGGDIVNVELGINIYKCGISLDVLRVGAEEEFDEEHKELKLKTIVKDEVKKRRITELLGAIPLISDYSKQARLLTDFTPDVLLGALQKKYSHRLQKALNMGDNKKIDLDRFEKVIKDVKDYAYGDLYLGIMPNIIFNEKELLKKAEDLGVKIVETPKQVIDKLIENLQI